jgi:hypothetical protein
MVCVFVFRYIFEVNVETVVGTDMKSSVGLRDSDTCVVGVQEGHVLSVCRNTL